MGGTASLLIEDSCSPAQDFGAGHRDETLPILVFVSGAGSSWQ